MSTATSFFPHHEVHVGKDLGGRETTIADADVRRYEAGTGGASAAATLDGVALAPALLFHSEVYRSLAWYLPNVLRACTRARRWSSAT
jgi:hypothetical protein